MIKWNQVLLLEFFFKFSFKSLCFFYVTILKFVTDFLKGAIRVIIIIIILSCHQRRYPWSSLTTSTYRSTHPAGPQGYDPYPHKAAVYSFKLITLLLRGYVKRSLELHHLWARPYFSSSVQHVLFVWFG